MELEILTGKHEGQTFNVEGETLIGRAEDCTIRLTDQSVSSHHARIVTEPTPQVFDLGSVNGITINGAQKASSNLSEGDLVNIGGVSVRVYLKGKKEATRQKEKTRRLVALVLAIIVFFLMVGGAWYFRQEIQKNSAEMIASEFDRQERFDLPGVNVYMPAEENFNVSLARYQAYTPDFLTIQDKGGYDSSAQLVLVETFPPDPLSVRYSYDRRSWAEYPPRLGSGRFLPEIGAALNQYVARGFLLATTEWTEPTPEPFVSVVGARSPLQIDFFVEVWEGLPPDAEIAYFSLAKKSGESLYEKTALIPKRNEFATPRDQFFEVSSGNEEYAQGIIERDGLPFQYYLIRQVKTGGLLVILTARCFEWQKDRMDQLMQEMIEAQEITPHEYTKPEERYERAMTYEKEADALLPNVMDLDTVEEWNLISERWRLLQAFNRYHKALVYLQQIDRWPHDDDFKRIYDKAEAIYNYVHDPRGYFRQTYSDIERMIQELGRMPIRSKEDVQRQKRKKEELNEKMTELHDITRRGQEPQAFPHLDEWFIYAHKRRQDVNRRWPD